MTRYIYPRYHELCKSAPLLARKAIIKAYEEVGNISEVARVFRASRKTVRKVLRRWEEEGESGLKDRSRRPRNSPRKTSAAVEGMIIALRKKTGYRRERIARVLREQGKEVRASTVSFSFSRFSLSYRVA